MAPLPERGLYGAAPKAFGGEKSVKINLASPAKTANISSPKLERQVGRWLKRQAVKVARERQELNAIGGAAALADNTEALYELREKAKKEQLEKLVMEKRKKRCIMEQSKKPVPWKSITMDVVNGNHSKRSNGMFYGFEFPWSEDLIADFGPEWLTKAMHASQTLADDNEVVEIITGGRKITAGNNGAKALFEVRYKRSDPDLDTKLFAKLPYPMIPATKTDRISSSVYKQPMDWSEINTYRLFEANLPFKTPKYYFGDISQTTSNFCLILARIPFAEFSGLSKKKLKPFEVEGPYDKCKDWMLKSPGVEYYKVIVQKISMIAGAYRSGKFAPEEVIKGGCMVFDTSSPDFRESCKRMSVDPKQYKTTAATGYNFLANIAGRLYPKYCQDREFERKYTKMAMLLNAYAGDIQYWKEGPTCEYFRGIGHMNLNIDNAYFWRNDNDELDCGVLDWGGFGINNLAHKIWWSMNCSEYEMIRDSSDSLLKVALRTYKEWGGPDVDFEYFKMTFMIVAMQNFMQMVGAIPNSLKMCKASEFATITNFADPRIAEDVDGKSTLRTTVWVLLNGVRMIGEMDASKYVDRWIREIYVGELGKTPKSDMEIFGEQDMTGEGE
mmetsp:Transcript_72509/g.132490  ORF Transcript_72509/g.132490 Transcript_72509/m.132490 type:complete len:613 (+) Transcript_72509:53-1891(+)